LKGLYSGGTLADEAMLIAAPVLGDIRSNTPLKPELDLGTDLSATGHVVIDFGDDALTVGRAHPMIDPTLRLEAIANLAATDEQVVLLLDVVLGHGAEPDPAAALAPVLSRLDVPVVASVVGTRLDPQDRARQVAALVEAGVEVHLSNARATRRALELLAPEPDGATR
jgi:FdrA protein